MGAKKYPIRLKFKATVGATGTGKIESDMVKPHQVIACQSIAFRNQTGARGTMELYIKQQTNLTCIADEPAPAANEWYWYPYTQHIKEGERIEAQQASCSADDVLDLHIIGYIIYESKGEIP